MSTRAYSRVLAAVLSQPWVIREEMLPAIAEVLAVRLSGQRFTDEELEARLAAVEREHAARPIGAARGGVAIMQLYGVLMPKASLFSAMSGGTSLSTFRAQFREAVASPQIAAIVIDVDSPGGLVDLVPETAADVRAARGSKPIVAIANTEAASAAYWIASQADELVATPSAMVGSIGVVAMHDDLSRALDAAGVTKSLISAGKFKTEGNPFEPLGDEARAAIQARVDEFYRSFTSDVARGRGVPVAAVRDGYGQGRVLTAQAALSEGMIDRLDTLEGVLRRLGVKAAPTRAAAGDDATTAVSAGNGEPMVGVEVPLGAVGVLVAAGPIAGHDTECVEKPWDGPGNEAKIPNDAGAEVLRRMYAWQDDDGDPDTKAAYKMPHHEVEDGDPGPANAQGCRAVLQRLSGSDIPEADHAGVEAHVRRHLDALEEEGDGDEEARADARRRREREFTLRERRLAPARP